MSASLVIDLCVIHEKHPRIVASDWCSPLICKLLNSKKYRDGSKAVEAIYGALDSDPESSQITLKWANVKEDFNRRTNTYQDAVLSEHAACGLACILVAEKANLEITEVTQRGDRADYWLGNREFMLEISGHADGQLDSLLDEKRTQLLANPHEASGYVCAAIFSKCVVCLQYYSYDEAD